MSRANRSSAKQRFLEPLRFSAITMWLKERTRRERVLPDVSAERGSASRVRPSRNGCVHLVEQINQKFGMMPLSRLIDG